MAGDWIKVEHTTPDKPEVSQLAESLGIDPDAAFGKVIRFWIWADAQSLDGNALSVTASFLDRITNCPGFTAALLTVGWLESRNGRFSVPHFDRHNGQTAKGRALTRDRVKRSRNAGVTRARAGPSSLSSGIGSLEEILIPEEINTPEFKKAWSLWIKHRAEIKKPLKPTQAEQQLKELAALGAEKAVAMIEYTIKKGWIGLREPEQNGQHYNRGRETDRVGPGQRYRPPT